MENKVIIGDPARVTDKVIQWCLTSLKRLQRILEIIVIDGKREYDDFMKKSVPKNVTIVKSKNELKTKK